MSKTETQYSMIHSHKYRMHSHLVNGYGLKVLFLFLALLSVQIARPQSKLSQQLDSINNVIESDNFDEDYKPVLQYLETIKAQGLSEKDLITRTRFLNYYAAALYYCGKYKESIPYFKMYIKRVEEDGWGEMSCEWLAVYQSMADAYYQLEELDSAESALRHAIICYENALDSCPSGYQCYELLSNIAVARHDSTLLTDIHHQTQQCFYNYMAIEDPSDYHKQLKKTFENYSEIVNEALALGEMDTYYKNREYRANFLKNTGWYEEAEFEHKQLILDMLKANNVNKSILQDAYLGLFIAYNKENAFCKVKEEMPHMVGYFSKYCDKENNLNYSCVLNQAAMTYEHSGDSLTAENLYKQAINLCPVDSIKNYFVLNYAYMINRVGVRLLLANKPDTALDYFSKVQLVSQDKRLNGTVLHNIGRANMLKGNYKVALQYLNESAAIQKETDGKIMDKTLSYIKECKDKI